MTSMSEPHECEKHGLVPGNDNPDDPCQLCRWERAGYVGVVIPDVSSN